MAAEKSSFDESFKAGADLSALQYTFVSLSTLGADTVDLATSASTSPFILGVLQNDPSSSQAANVRLHGISRLSVSAAIAVGAFVTTTTAGLGLGATTANQLCLGVALSASTASGQNIELLMTGPFRFSST